MIKKRNPKKTLGLKASSLLATIKVTMRESL